MKLVRVRSLQRTYRPKATIEIRVTQPRKIGKYTRVRTRRGKAPAAHRPLPDAGQDPAGEMSDGLSLRTTVLLVALAFGLTFAVQALLGGGSSAATPAAAKQSASKVVADAPGAAPDLRLAAADRPGVA